MKAVNILSVCGSGTVTSSMVAAKLKEKLGVGDTISINGEKARIYCFRINGW